MKIAVAGAGAFGEKHLEALQKIEAAKVTWLVGVDLEHTASIAQKYGVANATVSLDNVLARNDVDAVILCTPTPLHAQQACECLSAGKHVQIEIPLADSLADAELVDREQRKSRCVAMVGHTRRFNPSHQYLHRKIGAGDLIVHQMDVQTYFLRRENLNARGERRDWTDHLLWHHAAHTVDLFAYQTGAITQAHILQGPIDSKLGIAMDMSIQLKSERGAICTLSLSFNNDGPLGTTFRYICDCGTFIARYDDLISGQDETIDLTGVDVSQNGVELQDREFIAAIQEGRNPNSSVAQVLPCYRVLDQLQNQLN